MIKKLFFIYVSFTVLPVTAMQAPAPLAGNLQRLSLPSIRIIYPGRTEKIYTFTTHTTLFDIKKSVENDLGIAADIQLFYALYTRNRGEARLEDDTSKIEHLVKEWGTHCFKLVAILGPKLGVPTHPIQPLQKICNRSDEEIFDMSLIAQALQVVESKNEALANRPAQKKQKIACSASSPRYSVKTSNETPLGPLSLNIPFLSLSEKRKQRDSGLPSAGQQPYKKFRPTRLPADSLSNENS